MKWKICMMLCVSSFIISFPKNIIGCGPGIDPYDYYTSFFNPDIQKNESLRPFYYTGYNFLYDLEEAVKPADLLAKEWAVYCGGNVTEADAKRFVNKFSLKAITNLYYGIEKNQPLKLADSLSRNSMTNYFVQQKDLEALGYILFAKKAEPYVIGDANSWEPIQRDSLVMSKMVKNAKQLYNASKKDIFKLKYGYQAERLAHYSGNYDETIAVYDQLIAPIKTPSVLQDLALALKAGAIFYVGDRKQSAYLFSRVFSSTEVKKISNYLSFDWAVDSKADRAEYLSLCSNNREKADMLALFVLGSSANESNTLKEVYRLDPGNRTLETLAGREINKVEERYLTPAMNREKGGKLFYYNWDESYSDSTLTEGEKHVDELTKFLVKVAGNKEADAGFYFTAAAYTSLITKDFKKANQYLAEAKKNNLTGKVNDQWMLTNLLLAINQEKTISPQTEETLLPSLQWLLKKAQNDKAVSLGYDSYSAWKTFYRNIMAQALAKKYNAQGDIYKEALAVGSADKVFGSEGYNAIDFLHNKTDIKDVEKMYGLMTSGTVSPFENFLLQNNSVTKTEVIDFAGTAYLRSYDFDNAIKWLKRSPSSAKYSTDKNPFIDLLYDREEKFNFEKKQTTKLAFAQEMLKEEQLALSDKANAAKHYYRLATGFYNVTYYGHTWELVQYYRSGSDGYFIPKNATAFEKEYYGCFAAHDMFKNAMDASGDKNFKARCLFMMAKCVQKNVRKPQWNDFGDNYDGMQAADKTYFAAFMDNKYFPQLSKEYKETAFFREASTRCSYLFDFVKK